MFFHSHRKPFALLILCGACVLAARIANVCAGDSAPAAPNPATPPIAGFAWTKVSDMADVERVFPSEVDPATVYVSTAHGLFVSTDRGLTFKALPADATKPLGVITALLESPVRHGQLYAGTRERGVFASDDGGTTWRALGGTDKGLAHAHVHKLIFGEFDPSFTTLYALHSMDHGGVSVSIDGGKTWRVFAQEYGVQDLAVFQGTYFMAASHPPGQAEDGLYRGADFYRSLDAGKNWFRLLNVDARPSDLVGSRVNARSVWFATAGGRLLVTYDFGTSSTEVGPEKGMNTVSLARGLGPAGEERIFAYDPTGEGVIYSSDHFDTWQKLNEGLYVGDLVAEGAMMAANADGSVLYVVKNGELNRGAPKEARVLGAEVRAEPRAVLAGEGDVTFTCRTAKGADVKIDLTGIAGPADFVLKDDGQCGDGAADDGVYGGRYQVPIKALTPGPEFKGPKLPGLTALPVCVQKAGATEATLAVLYVLERSGDLALWNGESTGGGAAWANGGVASVISTERPFAGASHLRVSVNAQGQAGFSWLNKPIDARSHKYLAFFVRSNKPGATSLRVELRDDGRGYGLEHAGRSNHLDLGRYLRKPLSDDYQYVAIPLADFMLGGAAVPQRLREMVFDSPGEDRTYDFDEFALTSNSGARLGPVAAEVRMDGSGLHLSLRAINASSAIKARVKANGKSVDLIDDGKHGDGAPGDGSFGADIALNTFGSGAKELSFEMEEQKQVARENVTAFLPRRGPGFIPIVPANLKLDGSAAVFEGMQPFEIQQGAMELKAYLAKGPGHLFIGLAVKDAGFAPLDSKKKRPTVETLLESARVELMLTSPTTALTEARTVTSPFDHKLIFALTDRNAFVVRGKQLVQAIGKKTDGGYWIEAQLPLDWLHTGNKRCDFELGKATRIDWVLRGSDGKSTAWSGTPSENPDDWGLAFFVNEPGPPKLGFMSCAEKVATFSSSKPLDSATVKPASFNAGSIKIIGAEVSSDGRVLYLKADAWPIGQAVTLKSPGLRATDGSGGTAAASFTVALGRPVTAELLQEFLLGPVREGIDPTSVLNDDPPGTAELKPSENQAWRTVRSETGVFDLSALAGNFGNAAISAHVYVYSEADRTAQLWVGSDDGIKVHVNGAAVHTNATMRGAVPDNDKIPNLKFVKGWNRILLTITQGGGGWGFCARIVDDSGNPPKGLSYVAASPFGPQGDPQLPKVESLSGPKGQRVDAACTTGVAVENVEFRGWKNVWKLSNATCEAIVVPEVARILHFAMKDKPSVLWINGGLAGKTSKDDNQWYNLGGDKIWPAQQSEWGWPPPYHFDGAPNTAEAIPGGVKLSTPMSPKFGAQAVREIVLDEKKPLLRIRQTMIRSGDSNKDLTLWSVSQVVKPVYALLPLGQPVEKERHKPLGELKPNAFHVHKTVLALENDDDAGQKVGVRPDEAAKDGWVGAVFPGQLLVISHAVEKDGRYPDGGCHGELFSAPKNLGSYVELEMLSPLNALKKGETFKHDLVWQLVPIDVNQQDEPERAAAAARKAHEEALELLK